MNPTSGASAEDVELARSIVNVLGEQDEIGLISIEADELIDELAAALTAAREAGWTEGKEWARSMMAPNIAAARAEGERAGLERLADMLVALIRTRALNNGPSLREKDIRGVVGALLPPTPETKRCAE